MSAAKWAVLNPAIPDSTVWIDTEDEVRALLQHANRVRPLVAGELSVVTPDGATEDAAGWLRP